MLPHRIALICVFLPLISVHLTLFVGIAFDNLNFCNPYWSECHSISATGRQYPEFFLFKALLIPAAVFMAAYWLLLHQWIVRLNDGKKSPLLVTSMGVIASIALVVYTVTLGAEGYGLPRRIGVVFYFAFTSFGHLILLSHLDKLDTDALGIIPEQNRLSVSCIVLITTAIASAVAGYLWDETWDKWENAYEWWFSVLMISLFYQVGSMWRKTGFSIKLQIADAEG